MGVSSRKKEQVVPTVTVNTVKELIAEASYYYLEDINDDSLIKDMGMDSLDTVELIMDCEKYFNIKINDDDPELDNILKKGTVKDFSDYITKLMKSC